MCKFDSFFHYLQSSALSIAPSISEFIYKQSINLQRKIQEKNSEIANEKKCAKKIEENKQKLMIKRLV